MKVVVDTNVILRAFRSKNGASHAILRSVLLAEFECALSPAIVLEYEDVLKRPGMLGPAPAFTESEIDAVLNAICAVAIPVVPWFRFRPFLNDPKDDLYVECALAGGASIIVTDDRHFRHPAVPAFGLTAMTAEDFVSYQRRPK
jgi:putative PIN family toxin of toxin-antitoxin system